MPKDVLYFVHDSASYMGPAAERLRTLLGYRNLIHLPCWGHLLNVVGSIVFDRKLLPELAEFVRLNRFW